MGYKIKLKYPLFLRDINKHKVNNEENNIVNNYPIITIEDNFNIKIKPNTFYNINNDEDDEINITFIDEEFYTDTVENEFIFNINSPANISFNKEIKWDNNKEPDLTQIGVYTINIVNDIACYTFANT